MEKNGKLDPGNPEDLRKLHQEMQDKYGDLFEVGEEAQSEPMASVVEDSQGGAVEDGAEKENSSKKMRRGQGGKGTTPTAETKGKRRSKEKISEEEKEIRNYLDSVLLGVKFEENLESFGNEKIKRLRDLSVKSLKTDKDFELMTMDEKKQKALDMIIYEIDKELIGNSNKDGDEFKVLSAMRDLLEKGGNNADNINVDELGEVEKSIEMLKNELNVNKGFLDKVKKNSKKEEKILERIKLQEEKLERLEFDRDMLEGEEIDLIDDLVGKNGEIKKVMKKNGKATVVDSGEIFNVRLASNPKKGESILFDEANGGIKNTSGVLNIKRCLDGSYIIETGTSFYRLRVDRVNTDKKSAEEESEVEDEKKGEAENAAKEEGGENKEKGKSSIEEAYNKLRSFGAEDEDIKYFFNLKKGERNEFLNSSDDELASKIEDLKRMRGENDQKEDILAQDEVSQKFAKAGGEQEDIDYFYGNLNKEEREEIFGLDEEGFKNKIQELRAERAKNADGFQDDFSPEEIEKRFEKIGLIDDEKKYFYKLNAEDRLDFLNSEDEELKLRVEKLREAGIKEANEKIIPATRELEERRREYLAKEGEIKNTLARIKNFFRHIVTDDKYEAEIELEEYKQRYEESLKNYAEIIVDVEGLNDGEEREMMYRYVKFGETLNLMDAKADIEFQKHPMWEGLKRDLGMGSLSLIDKYKDLLGKSREFITQKTGSKILGIGGGAIAVGGAMSFLSGVVPGLRGFTRAMSIAVATKGFYDKAEAETIIEKEAEIKKEVGELERRFVYLQNFQEKIDKTFKEEIGYLIKDIPESAQKERDAVTKRVVASLGKATLMNIAFYEAGKALKDSGLIEEGVEAVKKFFSKEDIDLDSIKINGNEKQVDLVDLNEEIEKGSATTKPENIQSEMETSKSQGGAVHQGPMVPRGNAGVVENPISDQEAGIRRISGVDNKVTDLADNQQISSGRKLGSAVEFVETNKTLTGVELNKTGQGELEVVKGRGIKDSLASVLAKNSQNLTEGKMGWNPEKYKSVEEWANRRAIGIVAELKEKYPNYNFDKVSEGTKLTVDFNNRADIKIVGLDDPRHLGGDASVISELEKSKEIPPVSNREISPEKNISQVEINKDVETIKTEINRANTVKETTVVRSLGFKPDEYAELNNVSVRRLMNEFKDSGNPEDANFKLKAVMRTLMDKYNSDIMDKEVSEVIREMDYQVAKEVVSDLKDVSQEEYSTFINGMMRWEFELGMSERGPREAFVSLGKIRDESIKAGLNNEVFASFKGAVEKLGISFAYNDSDSVKSYVMKSMIKGYEDGKIGKIREALKAINDNIIKK